MKMIEIKRGNKTIYKMVEDDTPAEQLENEEFDLQQYDLTTSCRKSIGFSDISPKRWNEIFKPKDASN